MPATLQAQPTQPAVTQPPSHSTISYDIDVFLLSQWQQSVASLQQLRDPKSVGRDILENLNLTFA